MFSLEGPAQYICDVSTSFTYALTGIVYNIDKLTVSNELLDKPENVCMFISKIVILSSVILVYSKY